MKNLTITFALLFCANCLFAQELAPRLNPAAPYGYDLLGTRKLVGENRGYYGSVSVTETGPFNIKRTTTDTCFQLGELYPAMGVDGKSLFMNFDPDGTAHLTELPGTTLVFVRNGRPYACACGNLLKKAIKPAAPAPVITNTTRINNDTIVKNTVTIYSNQTIGTPTVQMDVMFAVYSSSGWLVRTASTGQTITVPADKAGTYITTYPNRAPLVYDDGCKCQSFGRNYTYYQFKG